MRKDYPFNFSDEESEIWDEKQMTQAYAPPEYMFPKSEKKKPRLTQCPVCKLYYEWAKNDRCPQCSKEGR